MINNDHEINDSNNSILSSLMVTRTQRYILRKKNTPLFEFSLITTGFGSVECRVELPLNTHSSALPYNFLSDNKSFLEWLQTRFVPKSRRFVDQIIASIGHDDHELITLLNVTFGLSLTDDYWIVPEELSNRTWEQHNLYDNDFSETLALVAFTGYRTKIKGIASSPEFTTNGMLPKCWRRINNKVYLYKGGTEGFANTGNEPYSEFYAAQVAEAMRLYHVSYELEEWKDRLCSVCELFTSPDLSFVPMWAAHREMEPIYILNSLTGTPFFDSLLSMIAFDAVIANQDRHLGNLGYLRSNDTGKLISLAPIFDNGMSLLHQAMDSDFPDVDEYFTSLRRFTFLDLPERSIVAVSDIMGQKQRQQLRNLLTFSFKRHPKHNLSEKRLDHLTEFVRSRARMLLNS